LLKEGDVMSQDNITSVNDYEIGNQINCDVCGGYWQKGFATESSWGFGEISICSKCIPKFMKWAIEKYKSEAKVD
jgi:hypothetical protein